MTTHEGAARAIDDALDDLLSPRLETRSTQPAAAAAAAGTDPIAALTESINRQTDVIERRAAPPPAAPARAPSLRARVDEARQSRQERQRRRLEEMRQIANRDRPGRTDPLDREQRSRINAAMNADDAAELARLRRENRDLQRQVRRPHGPTEQRSAVAAARPGSAMLAYRTAVNQYLRTGQDVFAGVHLRDLATRARLDVRAANTQDNTSGGYLVVPERDGTVDQATLKAISPMRALATVRTMSAAEFIKPVNKHGLTGRWVGEGTASTTDPTPEIALQRYFAMTMLAEPEATLEMLEDSVLNFEQFLDEESRDTFAEMEGAAFIGGDGQNRPKGILGYDLVADASWAYGKIGYLATGTSGAFDGTDPADVVRKTPLRLKAAYRQDASWLMNRTTMGLVRVMKDTTGRYIWGEGDVSKGIPNTLDGYPVNEDEQMPDIAAGSHAMGFGSWRRGYLILDRLGLSVIRNPYINAPNVRFHIRKRVAGGVQNFEAFKTIRFAAS